MISKKIYAQLPPKVEYALTELGQTVLPVIMALGKWGDDHHHHEPVASTAIFVPLGSFLKTP